MTYSLQRHKQGFSLIELSIVMAIIAILASSIIPIAIRSIQIRAGEKTALEMAMIQEASRNYYIDHKSWPAEGTDGIEGITTLKSTGYLNPNWVAENPWHGAYQISSTKLTLKVSTTNVPVQWTKLVASHLPEAGYKDNDTNVTSTISSWEKFGLQPGVIVAWSGSIKTIPAGWALCDGTNGTPDLRDKFIVGARQDDTGISKSNIMGILFQTGGSTTHNHGGSTGPHQLTIAEMPSHSHTFDIHDGLGGGPGLAHRDFNALAEGPKETTDTTGGNQSHSHPIFSDYNVPPFYALAFIMKL